MHQIDHIDDYIEPQLIIQSKAREIESLTRKGDYAEAFKANEALQAASHKLENWLWKHQQDGEK